MLGQEEKIRDTIMPPSSNSTISAASRTSALKILSPCFPGGLKAGLVAAINHSSVKYVLRIRAGEITRHFRQNAESVQCFTAAIFHVGFPCSTNLLNHAVWQAGIIQVISLFAAVFVCPVEELQHFCALLRFLLLFVNQNEGGRGDWPRAFTFLVSQILSEGFAPVSAFCSVGKVLFSRADGFAISRN